MSVVRLTSLLGGVRSFVMLDSFEEVVIRFSYVSIKSLR